MGQPHHPSPRVLLCGPGDKDLERKARRSLMLRPDPPGRRLSSSAANVGIGALAPGRGQGGFKLVQVRP